MIVHQYKDIKPYAQVALPFLEREEAANNLMIGQTLDFLNKPETSEELKLFTVHNQEQLVLVSMQTSPKFPLLVYGNDEHLEASASALSEFLKGLGFTTKRILGPKAFAEPFANIWKKYFQVNGRTDFALKVFRLDQVNPLKYSEGTFRIAEDADIPLLINWTLAFDQETFSHNITKTEAKIKVLEKMNSQDLYVWEKDGEVVTMAASARPTRHGTTINYVYTPKEHRRKGYASSCVACLSQLMLDKGNQFCSLFTDATNPTSNKIYQNIGYNWVADFSNIVLG